MTYGELLNSLQSSAPRDWGLKDEQRFFVTALPPETQIDTITLNVRRGGGPIGETVHEYFAVLVRHLGIVDMLYTWYVRRTGASGSSRLTLDYSLGIKGLPSIPLYADIRDIFPNPATDVVTVRIAALQTGPATLELYEVLGRKAATLFGGALEAGTQDQKMSINSLPRGIYLIVLRTQGNTYTTKLLL